MNNTNQPEKKFVAGPIAVTIWNNKSEKNGEEFSFPTITIDRNYKDKEGNWQHTNSLRASDLPKASVALSKAFEFLTLKEVKV